MVFHFFVTVSFSDNTSNNSGRKNRRQVSNGKVRARRRFYFLARQACSNAFPTSLRCLIGGEEMLHRREHTSNRRTQRPPRPTAGRLRRPGRRCPDRRRQWRHIWSPVMWCLLTRQQQSCNSLKHAKRLNSKETIILIIGSMLRSCLRNIEYRKITIHPYICLK